MPLQRRRFLQGLVVAGAGAALHVPRSIAHGDPYREPAEPSSSPASIFRTFRRPEDGLLLTFRFDNLRIVRSSTPAVLRRKDDSRPAYVVVIFPPQTVAEEHIRLEGVGFEGNLDDSAVLRGTLRHRLGLPSRVAFRFDDPDDIPMTAEHLLDWDRWTLSVVPCALPAGTADHPSGILLPPRAPLGHETAIELPWLLQLSPSSLNTFVHAADPVTRSGWTELWHTRLAVKIPALPGQVTTERPHPQRAVRAIWSRDPGFDDHIRNGTHPASGVGHPGHPFERPMSPKHRLDIVRASSDFSIRDYVPKAIPVERLWLTPLGGFLDSAVTFNPPDGADTEYWSQRTTLGRDHEVRIITKGNLFPFGHEAARVAVAERRFASHGGQVGAYPFMVEFIVVRQPVLDFEDRSLPFRRVRMATTTTPAFTPAVFTPDLDTSEATVPFVHGRPLQWQLVATDWDGRDHVFTNPLVWMSRSTAEAQPKVLKVAAEWLSRTGNDDYSGFAADGKRIAFAQSQDADDTTLETERVRIAGFPGQTGSAVFEPRMVSAEVRLGAADQIAGGDAGTTRIGYAGAYLSQGFGGGNPGQVWAALVAAQPVQVPADRAGAIVNPGFAVTGLSRLTGAVAGPLNDLAESGQFVPAAFFEGFDVKLLGGLSLLDVLAGGALGTEAPRLTERRVERGHEATLRWAPRLTAKDPLVLSTDEQHHRFLIEAVVLTDTDDPSRSTYSVEGEMVDFSLALPSTAAKKQLIGIPFHRLGFSSRTGQRAELDVAVDTAHISFHNEFSFIEAFGRYLSLGGGTGPAVTLSPAGIDASVSVELPDIKLGVFTLSNLSLRAGVLIPFTGEAMTTRFSLARRDDPFHLTVFGLGGGGYFALEFGLDGIQRMELALEAGAEVSVSLGPISGGLYCYVGIFIVLGPDELTVLAFFRMGGGIDCAIASVSIDLYMELGYEKVNEVAVFRGRATLTIEVSVLMFSESVEVSVERSFKASKNDPPFREFMPTQSHWADYCAAFAPVLAPALTRTS